MKASVVSLSPITTVTPEIIASADLSVETPGEGFLDITAEVRHFLARAGAADGALSLFLRHTSASLTIQENADPDVRDAALIAAAQRVEHYEIAGYGCARTFASILGDEETASLLQQSLDEEKETDVKLTELAMSGINVEAAEGDQEEDGEEEEMEDGEAEAPRRAMAAE